MEFILLFFHYISGFVPFVFLYRLLTPRIRFLPSLLLYFLLVIVIAGSLDAFVITYQSAFIRIAVVVIAVYIWASMCFEASLAYKIFAIASVFFISYIVEVICALTSFILTHEKMMETVYNETMLLGLRVYAITLNLLILEVLLHYIRKYDFYQIPYTYIVNLTLLLTGVVGNFVIYFSMNNDANRIFFMFIFTLVGSSILIILILKAIHKEYQIKKIEMVRSEVAKQYQTLLDDYLSIRDVQVLQKYIKHDLLNHVQILETIDKENSKEASL